MYKSASKETRDKVVLMAAEKKVRGELDDARLQLKKMSETKKEEKKKLADEDAARRIKQLEDQVETLRKQVANLTTQVEAQNQVVRKLEEKERLLMQSLATV